MAVHEAGPAVIRSLDMPHTIGVLTTEHIAVGLVDDGRITGKIRIYPEESSQYSSLVEVPAETFGEEIAKLAKDLTGGEEVAAIGVGVPGVVRDGVIVESPNLQQFKGMALREYLSNVFPGASVRILNDADAVAAGLAARDGHLDRLIRVWTLGTGIGFGRYPLTEGIWEGGHCVVTLDAKEQFCGCGGVGHLEGIMGYRAMRLRFLDMEPEEVFAAAREGDAKCRTFVKLWHRALAAATGSSIHMDGPGRFYICGPNARFVDPHLLNLYLMETVKMSCLQGSYLDVIATSATDELAVIGAAVSALAL